MSIHSRIALRVWSNSEYSNVGVDMAVLDFNPEVLDRISRCVEFGNEIRRQDLSLHELRFTNGDAHMELHGDIIESYIAGGYCDNPAPFKDLRNTLIRDRHTIIPTDLAIAMQRFRQIDFDRHELMIRFIDEEKPPRISWHFDFDHTTTELITDGLTFAQLQQLADKLAVAS